MKFSDLAKNLKMREKELREKIAEHGFNISPKAKVINNKEVKRIINALTKVDTKQEIKKEIKKVKIPSRLTVRQLSIKLELPVAQVITELMKNGIIATINEEIDYETAAIVSEDLGFKTSLEKEAAEDIYKRKGVKKVLKETLAKEDKSKLKRRPPVVAVMGHIDHGKTALLDAIRQTNVVAEETGGITQRIGAYQVCEKGKIITFLDTPGHEAFASMRARGAKVTDITVLVVAADEGVKPQTKEAIDFVKKANIPLVVAINKIDKEGADPERVKKQLAEIGVLPEEWGGDTIFVLVSAKQKKNINELLDSILLVAEMEELKANPEAKAIGTIIESHKSADKGIEITVLVQNGTLKVGDPILVGSAFGVIRSMENFQGKKISFAKPSTPVKILGLEGLPEAGDILQVEESRTKAKAKIAKLSRFKKPSLEKGLDKGAVRLNLIIKANEQGSLEAILETVAKLKFEEAFAHVIDYNVGKITESDVMLAASSNALIVGFNVDITPVAKRLADKEKVEYKLFDIIYKLTEDLTERLQRMLTPEIIETRMGRLKVLAVFRTERGRMIVGGRVTLGKVTRGLLLKVIRDKEEIGRGRVTNLQINKVNVDEAKEGDECGILFEGNVRIKEGDILEFWKKEEKKVFLKKR